MIIFEYRFDVLPGKMEEFLLRSKRLPKPEVAGSRPVARSILEPGIQQVPGSFFIKQLKIGSCGAIRPGRSAPVATRRPDEGGQQT